MHEIEKSKQSRLGLNLLKFDLRTYFCLPILYSSLILLFHNFSLSQSMERFSISQMNLLIYVRHNLPPLYYLVHLSDERNQWNLKISRKFARQRVASPE